MQIKTVSVKLPLADNVKVFVSAVSKYPYDMKLRTGRYVVDAKSILGILSLDRAKLITMEIYCEDCTDLMTDIKSLVA